MTQQTSTTLKDFVGDYDPQNWAEDLLDSVAVLDETWTQGSAIHMEDSQAIRFGAGYDASLEHDGTTGLDLLVADNDSGAFDVKQGGTSYMTFDTTDDVERVDVKKPLDAQAGFDRSSYYELFDDFDMQQTWVEAETPWIWNSGGDAGALDPTIVSEAYGYVQLQTGTAVSAAIGDDGSQLVSHVPFQAQKGNLVFETRLHIDTAVTTVSVNAGLTDATGLEEPFSIGGSDAVTSTASDGACFVYDTGADTDGWFGLAVKGDTDDKGCGTLAVKPTAGTDQVLRMEINSTGGTIKFFVDGALARTMTTGTGVTASTNLYPTVTANTEDGTQRTVDVDYVYCGMTRS